MSLGTSNRDGGKTSESGHLRALGKIVSGDIITGLNAVQRAAGVNMSVDVQVGDAFVRRSDGTYSHPVFNDAVYNQVISAADGSNPRRDIVVIYVDYGQTPSTAVSNNTNGVVKIKVVNGTPAGSPVDPNGAAIQSSVGAGNPYSILARVRVPAGQTTISNTLIDDLRVLARSNELPGVVKDYAGATAPVGYLLCYGQAISRTTYLDLFVAIGTLFGVGDGSTTFNLPDLRGRTIAGQDDMGGTSANRLTGLSGGVDGDVLGAVGGGETHTHTIPNHSLIDNTNGGAYTTVPSPAHAATSASTNIQPTMILNKIIAY
jgi:microcystin-dependent protein